MNDFKLPDDYYQPKETLAWSQGCCDCEWVDENIEVDAGDLENIEECPVCHSGNLYTVQDYYQD